MIKYNSKQLFILLFKLYWLWSLGVPSVCHLYVIGMLHLFHTLPHFLAQDLPRSSCTFPAPSLDSMTSLRSPLIGELYLEVKILFLVYTQLYCCVFTPRPSQQTGNIGMNTNTPVYLHLY